jgi:hypothetical protein
MVRLILFVFALVFLFNSSAAYTDTIILKNGDVIICNVKELKQGVLKVSTSYSDTDFKVKWTEIKQLRTSKNYNVFTRKDGRFFGTIKMIIRGDTINGVSINDIKKGNREIALKEVVYLKDIRKTFWNRLNGKIGVGYNWTKAQNVQQLSIYSNLNYWGDQLLSSASFNLSRTTQDSVANITRNNGSAYFGYLFPNRFLIFLREDFLQNTEQEINLRVTSTLGPGYIFVYNYMMRGVVTGGVSWNNELFEQDVDRTNSVELFTGIDYAIFNWHDFDLSTTCNVYPSMTNLGRVRIDYKVSLNYDLPWDFFVGGTFNLNYDNRPSANTSKSDFVLQVNFGWKWDP